MEKKKYYYARYNGIDKYDTFYIFYIFDTKETIYVQKIINLSGKKLNDNDLVCIEKDCYSYDSVTIMDVLDNNIAWSEHYIKRYRQEYEIHSIDQRAQMVKYNQRFSNKKLTLVYHTIKHPICDDISKRKKWESMGINYLSGFLPIKSKYDDISRNLVIDNIHSKWEYNPDYSSLNFIDNNELLVSLKFKNGNPEFKIVTLHFKTKKNSETLTDLAKEYYSYFFVGNINEYAYDFKNIINQMKRKKTRYFKDNPGDFYSSVMYDFDDIMYGLACLKYCHRYRDKIDEFSFDDEEYEKYLLKYREFILNGVEEKSIYKIRNEFDEFINYDIDNLK